MTDGEECAVATAWGESARMLCDEWNAVGEAVHISQVKMSAQQFRLGLPEVYL